MAPAPTALIEVLLLVQHEGNLQEKFWKKKYLSMLSFKTIEAFCYSGKGAVMIFASGVQMILIFIACVRMMSFVNF
jgi:hypothetical protein